METTMYTLLGISKPGLEALWSGMSTGAWMFSCAFALGLTARLGWLVGEAVATESKASEIVKAPAAETGTRLQECA